MIVDLMYSWTFDYQTLDTSRMNGKSMDLSISFASEKQKEIEELTGQTNGLYISINGYHGELPGPALVKTYVGEKYKNGDKVYLYYYNEETKKVELVGGEALTVSGGYVEYTLTHCSTYLLSENTPDKYGIAVEPKVPSQPGTSVPQTPAATSSPVVTAPKKSVKGVNSGDSNMPFVPLTAMAAGFGIFGFAMIRRKRG